MSQIQEYEVPGGSLKWELVGKRGVQITGFSGLAGEVEIPEQINGLPVVAIGRKAFLSKKNLRKVTVPSSVEAVEDWAFAYCDHLRQVVFEGTRYESGPKDLQEMGSEAEQCTVSFGRAVFLECKKLQFLYLNGDTATAALLAAAVTTAEAPYLLNAAEAGTEEWLAKWDARMISVLNSADDDGYSKQVLCGEEDYGSTDLTAYKNNQRKRKVRLLLLRRMYDRNLDSKLRERMDAYLRAHTKGCRHEETWQVILEEFGDNRDYYELFAKLGCITSENFQALLAETGEEHPEFRAYLMRYKEDKLGYGDFFGGLEL